MPSGLAAFRHYSTYACRARSASPGAKEFPQRAVLPELAGVDHEDERLVRPDRRRLPVRAVGQVGRYDEHPAAARLHPDEALGPALDHALPERERERLLAVPRRVELLAGRPRDA